MTYGFARVSATTRMRLRDYYSQGRPAWFVPLYHAVQDTLYENNGRFKRVPAHHKAAEYVDAYLGVAGIAEDKGRRAFAGRDRDLSDRRLRPAHVPWKRRLRQASCRPRSDALRATAITGYLANGGTLETTAHIAGHAAVCG